jgi:hypothetical protein
MDTASPEIPRFTWVRLVRSLAMMATVAGLVLWFFAKRDGGWTVSSTAAASVMVWIFITWAYRYSQLIKEQSNGTFSAERYASDPSGYLWGTKLTHRVRIGVGVAIAIVILVIAQLL